MASQNQNTIGDTYCNGTLQAKTLKPSSGCVTDDSVAAGANIDGLKVKRMPMPAYTQAKGSAVVSQQAGLHIVMGATGGVLKFQAALAVACLAGATVTVDMLKNGASILAAPITFNSGVAAYSVQSASIASPNVAQGDVLEVNVVATAGGGTVGQGLIAQVQVNELPQ